MGNICTSCYSGANSVAATTVKLILLDGQLREFSSPVKVFLVAPPPTDPCSFICNADEMDFDKDVTAMSDDDELRPGQLYFQLPSSWLKRPLAAEDMASLAVKAGSALMLGAGGGDKVRCGCCVTRVDPLVLFVDEELMSPSSWRSDGGDNIGIKSPGGGGRHGKGRVFASLEKIEEE